MSEPVKFIIDKYRVLYIISISYIESSVYTSS